MLRPSSLSATAAAAKIIIDLLWTINHKYNVTAKNGQGRGGGHSVTVTIWRLRYVWRLHFDRYIKVTLRPLYHDGDIVVAATLRPLHCQGYITTARQVRFDGYVADVTR